MPILSEKSVVPQKAGKEGFHISTVALVYVFAAVIAAFNLGMSGSDQWQMLAQSFLHGKLYFLHTPNPITDSAFWAGRYYWPFGPFPAVVFMPFVALADVLKVNFLQGWIQFPLVVLVFVLAYRVGKKFFSADDAAWFAVAFTFASAFLWIASMPGWGYLPYVFSAAAMWAALYEYLGRKRQWLIGLLMAIVLASRTTAALGIVFFLGDILFLSKITWRKKIKSAVELLAPFVVALLLLAVYNYARFGNVFETGYAFQISANQSLTAARAYGLFSIVHVPGNLYYFLFSAPLPVFRDAVSHVLAFPFLKANPWGMSILVTSPYLLALFFLSHREKISRLLIATAIIVIIPSLLFFGLGYRELGYRFALDFMPFVYFLFMRNYAAQFGALSIRLKWLIALSALFDLYLLFTLILIPS
jgi:hypothetical protein